MFIQPLAPVGHSLLLSFIVAACPILVTLFMMGFYAALPGNLPSGAACRAGHCHGRMGAAPGSGCGQHCQWCGFFAPAGHVDRALRAAPVQCGRA